MITHGGELDYLVGAWPGIRQYDSHKQSPLGHHVPASKYLELAWEDRGGEVDHLKRYLEITVHESKTPRICSLLQMNQTIHGSYGDEALLPDKGIPPFSPTRIGSSSLTPKPLGFPIL